MESAEIPEPRVFERLSDKIRAELEGLSSQEQNILRGVFQVPPGHTQNRVVDGELIEGELETEINSKIWGISTQRSFGIKKEGAGLSKEGFFVGLNILFDVYGRTKEGKEAINKGISMMKGTKGIGEEIEQYQSER